MTTYFFKSRLCIDYFKVHEQSSYSSIQINLTFILIS